MFSVWWTCFWTQWCKLRSHTQHCLSYGSFDGVKFWQNRHKMRPRMFPYAAAAARVFLSHFWTGCIPASSPQISLSLWQPTCLSNRSLRQQDTDIKDRLLRNQCLKCDYNQMCMQIVSESEDFAVSHRCMLSQQSFVSCHQRESEHPRISAIWQERLGLQHDTKKK